MEVTKRRDNEEVKNLYGDVLQWRTEAIFLEKGELGQHNFFSLYMNLNHLSLNLVEIPSIPIFFVEKYI